MLKGYQDAADARLQCAAVSLGKVASKLGSLSSVVYWMNSGFFSSSSDCMSWLRLYSFNTILFSTFFTIFFYQMSQTVQTFSLSESDAAPIALLSDMFVIWQMGWWKDLNSIRKAQEGTPRCQMISQKSSVIIMSSKNITHPWRQMCILNSSLEGSGVGESIHLKTIYYILLIWPAYWDRLI